MALRCAPGRSIPPADQLSADLGYPPLQPTLLTIAGAGQLSTSFWMLPPALDEVVSDPRINLGKCLNLPLLVGLPFGLRRSRLPPLGRAFIWANFTPKITVVGALYLMTA
jgi:hypothetical protein